MKSLLSATILAGSFLCGASMSANALPASPAPMKAQPQIEKVHGFHRSCRGAPAWRHRHARRGRTVHCGPRFYRYPAPGITLYFGDNDRRGHRHYRKHRHERRRHRH